ncbi:MAG: DEAD/DEAH box helicase [Bacteroidetes bacterium]|nr:DEAD/DEAH box helicase [Bacteroidota bacterium]
MRLVDATLPFQVVYSIYHHEYLGYLISSHVVQSLPNGELSLVHHRLLPENMNQFSKGLDDDDKKLIALTDSISPRQIIKKFHGNPRKEVEFFTTKFDGELKKLAMNLVQRQLAQIMAILSKKQVFEMGNDGYPAKKNISFLQEDATIWFHFRRKETFTRYYPTIKLKGETIKLTGKGAIIICENPAWILLQGELFTFKSQVDGKKLKPFLRKDFIAVPRDKEEEYYRKFVTQLVERYPVVAKGFQIKEIREEPHFQIRVKDHNGKSFSFVTEVVYDTFTIELRSPEETKAILKKNGDDYTFYRIVRHYHREKEIYSFLQTVQPNQNSLTPWEYVEKEKGLVWVSKYTQVIQEKGIAIVQENQEYKLNLLKPEVVMSTVESGDWFDIKAMVNIGAFSIPFIKFRNHILKGKREYLLPDGTVAILPEEWFSDFHHLMEVSELRNGETFSIKKYQVPLLSFPSSRNGLAKMVESIKDINQIPETAPPVHLKATLRNYQSQGYSWLNFMKEHGMGAILADDMGLGKTLQTLSLLMKEKETGVETPSLIVLPTSLIYNWANEAKKFTPKLNVLIHTGVSRSKDPQSFSGQDLILTTYGIVRQDIEILKGFPFHYVVLDESQMIKNPDSKTAKAVKKLVSRHKLSLTGTPIENTVMDIWSQMSFLNPGLLGNENFFRKFYVTPIEKDKDQKRSAKLQRIIYPYILRRKKQQVEKELPPKIEQLHYCDMEEAQQEFYEETRSIYRNYLMDLISQGTWKKNKLNILTGLQKLRQIAIHPKLVAKDEYDLSSSGKYLEVKRLLHEIMAKKRSKVLIFSQFVKMLQILKEDLTNEGIKFNYLDGNTKDRQAQVDSFQNDKEIRAFLISLKAGGVGLNLTAAHYVFILDPWWNPAVENQAIDRSHRIGQKRTVLYYKFITKDSIEEKILNLQRLKKQLSDNIITVEEDIYKSLDAIDLEELLK